MALGMCAAALTVAVLAAAGCSPEQPALSGTSWRLTGWGEATAIPDGVTITARFDDSTLSGTSGVNSYAGDFEAGDDGSFAAGPFAGTMMAGPPEAMEAEAAYLRRLEEAASWVVAESTLLLIDAEGQDSLTYTSSD
jgi:heat shock protein HslJ